MRVCVYIYAISRSIIANEAALELIVLNLLTDIAFVLRLPACFSASVVVDDRALPIRMPGFARNKFFEYPIEFAPYSNHCNGVTVANFFLFFFLF